MNVIDDGGKAFAAAGDHVGFSVACSGVEKIRNESHESCSAFQLSNVFVLDAWLAADVRGAQVLLNFIRAYVPN